MKDYLSIVPELTGMSEKQLRNIYQKYRKRINSRIYAIEKTGKYENILSQRKKSVERLLTQGGRIGNIPESYSKREIKLAIMDMGYYLNLKTTTLRGIETRNRRTRKALEKRGIKPENIDDWLDFLKSETYKALEEQYASSTIENEFEKIQDEGLSLEQVEEAFKIWKEQEKPIPLDEIVKKYIKLQ